MGTKKARSFSIPLLFWGGVLLGLLAWWGYRQKAHYRAAETELRGAREEIDRWKSREEQSRIAAQKAWEMAFDLQGDLTLSQEARLLASDSLQLILRQRNWARRRGRIARDSLADARDSLLFLRAFADLAAASKDSLDLALNSARRTVMGVTDRMVFSIDSMILALNYPDALERVQLMAQFGIRPAEVLDRYLEIAYFHNEAGMHQRALEITDTTILFLKRAFPESLPPAYSPDSLRSREGLRRFIDQIKPGMLRRLDHRYYPRLAVIAGGSMVMGRENGAADEPPHPVSVDTFLIAFTETTVWQFHLFVTATGRKYLPPPWGWLGDHPVVDVNWYDAVAYSNWLSRQKGLQPVYKVNPVPEEPVQLHYAQLNWSKIVDWSADGFRLPTEAEWEFAAREGGMSSSSFPYSGSDDIQKVAWFKDNAGETTHPVATRPAPNGLGIYDLSGNCWEWCWDWYDAGYYGNSPPAAPRGPDAGRHRVIRGGSWYSDADNCRVSFRGNNFPYNRNSSLGFRVAQGWGGR